MTTQQRIEAWFKALSSIEEKEKKRWIKWQLEPKKNLPIFGRFFFPHIVYTDVPDLHTDMIQEFSRPKDSASIIPRNHGKSTWEKIDTIHDIVYKLEPVILYISAILQDAQFHFESIKSELENNEALRYVYGNLVPDLRKRESVKWTNTHFETTNSINVVARGANKGRGVNIKNKRPTKVIIDDAETDEQVRSYVRRQKYHDWLYNVIFPSLDKERGRIKMIGTVIHPEVEILKFYEKHGGIFRKAIENGKSVWPERFSLDDLEKIKEKIGTRAYMQEYQNEPVNEELARINPVWIDERVYTVLPSQTSRLQKVITLDPQAGESDGSDEYAITIVGWYTGDRHRYVLEQKAGKASQIQQATEVVKMWQANKEAHVVGIEKVMTQVAVYQLLLDWKAGSINFDGVDGSDRNIPIMAIGPQGSIASMQRKGSDKVARFQIHEPAFERGEIHLRPEMTKLREQILFLGTDMLDHDDRVDSLVFALDLSYQGRESHTFEQEKSPMITSGMRTMKF